ncbi:single-stranded DNA-binding protein [uncultured Lactobacillus sp.]|uniref:single-stranded DNA-binding protein n=1 Tax=uncultured Lactobacillus sp. TaxID=153152 RepID=UPI0026024CBC|nr:single-stranded DNA-binding protein [uncultured Lactobacillus sp.]
MGLYELANQLDKSGFDPNEGKEAGGRQSIPVGDYLVSFDNITHNVNNDRDFLMITFKVMEGKYADRTESIFPSLALKTSKGNDMPDFVISRSISQIKIIGAMCGITVPNSVFAFDNETEAYEAIVPVLRPGIGTLMKLHITETPNKKNPDSPYRNYEFAKATQPSMPSPQDNAPTVDEDPFKDAKTGAEITSDDLPFNVDDMKGDK